MKRKIMSLLLTVAMLLTLVSPVFAEEGPGYTVESGVASINSYKGLCNAMADGDVTSLLIDNNTALYFDRIENFVDISKPLVIDGTLHIINSTVAATADITVNGQLQLYGDFDSYTELRMDAPDRYWTNFTNVPEILDGPQLINNGKIIMDGLSGIMLSWPCSYSKGANAELSGGEFKFADFLNYDSNESDEGLTACYTEAQANVETVFYDDNGHVTGKSVLRTAYVNTEKGLKAALASNVYNSSIQVFGKEDVTLTKGDKDVEYNAPCTLMTNVPFTVGEGVTLNLAKGVYNSFNDRLTVAGTLNVDSENNITFVYGDAVISAGGIISNESTSDLCFVRNLEINGTLENRGNLQLFGNEDSSVQISGQLKNFGRMENCTGLFVNSNGVLEIPDSNSPITYDSNARDDNGNELGWDGVSDHIMFNRGFLKVEEGGQLNVGGALKNDGNFEILGQMTVSASAVANNAEDGVVNGSVKNFRQFEIKDNGSLTIKGAEDFHYPAIFVNLGNIDLYGENPQISVEGSLYQYNFLHQNGGKITVAGELLNEMGDITVDNGSIHVSGYLRNDSYINLNRGIVELMPAAEQNCGEDPSKFNEKCSVLCNNSAIYINADAELQIDAKQEENTFNALLRNNGSINNGGSLKLSGSLDNSGNVKNFGDFIVSGSAAHIDNHGHLYVKDSQTFTPDYGTFNPINWADGASAENNLFDEEVYRVWLVYGPEYRKLEENFSSIKNTELYGNIVMHGQDYFGGWEDAENCSVEVENTDIIGLETGENYDTFRLSYKEWGDTKLNIKVDDNIVRSYDVSCCLNYAGFYSYRAVDGNGMIDENEAKGHAAILGNVYTYNLGDSLWLMRNDMGFDEEALFNNPSCQIELWFNDGSGDGGEADINPNEDGSYRVSFDGEEYFIMKPEKRPNSDNKYDILFEFTGGKRGYDMYGNLNGTDFNLKCIKPAVYVETVPGVKGKAVTVAVEAEDITGLEAVGYQLRLKYNPEELTAPKVDSTYQGLQSWVDAQNGYITLAFAGDTDGNNITQLLDGELFKITFTVSDTVGKCQDLEIKFDDDYEQKFAMIRGNDEPLLDVRLEGGMVQTFIPGDVHRDGMIDIRDAVRLLRYCVRDIVLSQTEYEAAKLVEGKTEPDVAGVVKILEKIVKGTELDYHGSL